jgi:hypothetical protein
MVRDTAQKPLASPTVEDVVLWLEGEVVPADDAPVGSVLQAARQHHLAWDLAGQLFLLMNR